MTDGAVQTNGWQRFWNRGGWWRALLITVVYAILYQLVGLAISAVFGGFIDHESIFADGASVVFGVALPILISGVLLTLFVWSVGWLPTLLQRQPVGGRGWMWIAVVLVLVPVVLRLVATDWSNYSIDVVLAILFLGLCIGFSEELLTRGVGVNLLRLGGYSERLVLVLSSLLFAVLHSTNALTGQTPLVVGVTVIYAFGFGATMYLSMRVTGSVVWAMLLHAATDPTTILATGGIDSTGAAAGNGELLAVAGIFNYVYVALAIVAIFLVKDRVRAGWTRLAPGRPGV